MFQKWLKIVINYTTWMPFSHVKKSSWIASKIYLKKNKNKNIYLL